ncbi:MAG: MarR family transcriptional regulator [Chloroflexales bacterium]|nr:MarR family transcriptional regulator [Chloroflexales bacterium]
MAKTFQLSDIHVHWEPLPASLTSITGFMLYWVTGLAGQFYAQAVAKLSLEPQQAAILQLLEAEGDIVQSRLAERLCINKATMVFLLDGLKGLVERKDNSSDKRTLIIRTRQTSL